MDSTKDETSSYVTYGMLHKNHEFVDWVRVDLEEDDMIRVQNANANILDDNSLKDMDERAFEKLKAQWQEISVSDAMSKSASDNSISKVQDSIVLGSKKLLATAQTKTLTPDSISYGVFDADWNPVKLYPRHSNVDVAILLHAASKGGNNKGMRTNLKETLKNDPTKTRADHIKSMVDDGKLPLVPVKQSPAQQLLLKQSVQLFFRQNSIQFFACFPLRNSPRTIYRFDMVNGGIDHTFWQKMKINSEQNIKPTMNDKLIEMKTKVVTNTAAIQTSFKTGTDDFKTKFDTTMSSTRESIISLTTKKTLLTNNNNDESGEKPAEKPKVPAKERFSMMRMKMSSNAFNMKNSFASKVSTTKDSLLKTNQNKPEGETTEVVASPEKPKKLSFNAGKMKFGFGNRGSLFGKKPAATAESEAKPNMTERLSGMKLRMSENTNQMKERMSQNTLIMKNTFASTVAASKQSLLNIKKTASGSPTKKGESNADNDIDSFLSEEEFTFTIDGEDDDDESGLMSSVPSTTPKASSPVGYVALSFDDAPCRFDDRSHSQLENVLDLLKKYDAKATFMVVSSFLADCHEPDMIRLLHEGHELANHGVRDEPMDKMATSVEVFVEAIDECNTKIQELQTKANTDIGVKWFRAPQSKYTKIMEEGLIQRNMHNVMCDAYAACPIVEDGPWIASMLNKQIRNGSIALLHIPEKCGFREHCLEALEHLLKHLQKRNMKVVSIGELHKLSEDLKASKEEPKEEETKEEPKEDAEVELL